MNRLGLFLCFDSDGIIEAIEDKNKAIEDKNKALEEEKYKNNILNNEIKSLREELERCRKQGIIIS